MAAGDVVNALSSVADAGFLDIQPAGSDEYVIHNVHHGGSAELYFYDGTNQVKVFTAGAEGSWMDLFIHVTNAIRYRIKNTSGGAAFLGYDGIQTK